MAHFSPDFQVISKKKRSSPKLKRFFCPNSGDLQKKKRPSVFHFDWPYEAHGPRGHCLPLPPLSEALKEYP